MTVTLVFGATIDGYLYKGSTNYNTARNNPADGVTGGDLAYIGQHYLSGWYAQFQTFLRWSFGVIPDTERITSAVISFYIQSSLSPGLPQTIEVLGNPWNVTSAGLATSDWVNPDVLAASRLDAAFTNANAAQGKMVYAGSNNLNDALGIGTDLEDVVVTDRQRMGIIGADPSDEAFQIVTSDYSGTSFDPALIYTSTLRSTLFGVLGAQVQISDGSWAYLESDGALTPTVTLKHRTVAGVTTTVHSLPLSIGTVSTYAYPIGAQNFALAIDELDNIYVIGRAADALNSVALRTLVKGVGNTWTANNVRYAAMPAHSTVINNIAATYHTTNGGTLFVVVGHRAGPGALTSTPTGLSHAAIATAYVTSGTGSATRSSGYTMSTLLPAFSQYMRHPNETGSGLDVAQAGTGNAAWGYVFSFTMTQELGANYSLDGARYILNSTATAFTHASYEDDLGYAKKDANAKVRVVRVSDTAAAFVTADADAGWGITVDVMQHTGTVSGSTRLGGEVFAGESIASMPDGPAIAASLAWDVVYNSADNRLWVYYVDKNNPLRLMRTAFDLTTMNAVRNEVVVYTAGAGITIQGVRVQRNKHITTYNLVAIATITGTTRATVMQLDTFNLAPTAPTLTTKANYDATTASTFSWTFNDPNAGDTQSAYQFIIERVDTGATVVDTGKVVSTTASRNVTASTLTNGLSYRWKVRTYDALDFVSPYSGYGTFSTATGGTVTITTPATDNMLGVVTSSIPIAWSVAGTTQAAYRVWLYRGATLVSDTNWVTSTATTLTVTGMTSDTVHTIQVQVRNGAAVVSGVGSRLVTPSFATPEVPLVTVSVVPLGGYTEVSVDNPPPGLPASGSAEWNFEVAGDVMSWVMAGGTRAHSTAQAHRGTGTLLMTVSGTPTLAFIRNPTNRVAVVAGARYTARMWVYCSVARTVGAGIDWYTAGGVYVSSTVAEVAVPATTWTAILATGAAPATATLAEFGPSMPLSPPNGTLLYVDELVLTGASDRPEVITNQILRRKVGDAGGWEVVGTCGTDGTFRDYQAASGVLYHYKARGNS
jgi:hypothetical protein